MAAPPLLQLLLAPLAMPQSTKRNRTRQTERRQKRRTKKRLTKKQKDKKKKQKMAEKAVAAAKKEIEKKSQAKKQMRHVGVQTEAMVVQVFKGLDADEVKVEWWKVKGCGRAD